MTQRAIRFSGNTQHNFAVGHGSVRFGPDSTGSSGVVSHGNTACDDAWLRGALRFGFVRFRGSIGLHALAQDTA